VYLQRISYLKRVPVNVGQVVIKLFPLESKVSACPDPA
jgi:hypothetical protein